MQLTMSRGLQQDMWWWKYVCHPMILNNLDVSWNVPG